MTSVAPPRSNPGRPELFRQLMECSQNPILTKTADRRITFWNTAAERLFGYRAGQAVGRHVELVIPSGLKAEEAGLLRRLAAGERIEHYETRRLTRDGRQLDIDVTLWPIRDRSGTITGACSTMRDVTGRKRAQQELAELRHLSLALRLMGEAERVPGTDAAARYLPSTQGRGVGGDCYDLIDFGAGRTGIIIGDVMGRGLEAAVVMGQLRSAARALALHGVKPRELMATLDTFTGRHHAGAVHRRFGRDPAQRHRHPHHRPDGGAWASPLASRRPGEGCRPRRAGHAARCHRGRRR